MKKFNKMMNILTTKRLIHLVFFILLTFNLFAQDQKIKVVFDLTSSSPVVQKTAIRHISMMAKAYPDSEFEMVMYSGAGKLATYENKELALRLSKVTQMDNAKVVLCEATMRKLGLNKNDLVKGVQTVPDGILEIALKQANGWGYIKEGLNSSN